MRTIASIVLSGCLIATVACGGKKGATTPDNEGGGDVADGDEGGQSIEDPCAGGLCPPEKLDEIKSLLDRKRTAASRCLSEAVLAGKAPKNTRGHVGLAFVIGRNGRARDIKITESTIKNPEIEQCVVSKVESIDFGDVPTDLDWSYAYAFESN